MEKRLYIVAAMPYPSGPAHIGHWYNYSIVDSYARLKAYKGINVWLPWSFDSFGLPAENAAIKMNSNPETVTNDNINAFWKEMKRMDTGYEWQFSTHLKSYQEKTQRLFGLLLQNGLAFKDKRMQNYCPDCKTVLANEQVIMGHCERCDTQIIEKEQEQWFFRITDYRQRLIDDLDKVDYPEKTKKQQREWLANLSDWCVSRQRKWGCPIPVEGETDTLDTFVDSSFYTTVYDNKRPVDLYVIGNEHACMHLIYARFITKFLYDIGEIPFDEPFSKVIHQGMILKDGVKMSKSKGNVINPLEYDPGQLRMYLMFIAHYFDGGSWSDQHFKGIVKFDKRIRTILEIKPDDPQLSYQNAWNIFNEFKDKVKDNFEQWKVNKVISEWMIYYNEIKGKEISGALKLQIKDFYSIINPTILHESNKTNSTGSSING